MEQNTFAYTCKLLFNILRLLFGKYCIADISHICENNALCLAQKETKNHQKEEKNVSKIAN